MLIYCSNVKLVCIYVSYCLYSDVYINNVLYHGFSLLYLLFGAGDVGLIDRSKVLVHPINFKSTKCSSLTWCPGMYIVYSQDDFFSIVEEYHISMSTADATTEEKKYEIGSHLCT